MDYTQAYEYLMAKSASIKVADKEDSYNSGLNQFLVDKSYKPAHEPFKLREKTQPKKDR
jgi:feruloyl-CoA hydratase/lyase